ncbi:hypothetical protein ACIHAX_36695 [Nocardia sp. NPDC051929]|uniref:hypothetical protein n=1 Tax=Nocardia sp. NPDC051929 TaxID=3364327 RepID=UPI0037CA9C32
MSVPNNPAHRLAMILQNALGQPADRPIIQTLKNVLGCSTDSEFFPLYGELRSLPEHIEGLIRQHISEEHHSFQDLLSWRANIENALTATLSLGKPSHTMTACYGPPDIQGLRICGGLLSQAGVEGRVDADTLTELRTRVQELYDLMQEESEIPADLRSFVCDQLDVIRRALREFIIYGPEALDAALTQIAGAMVRNQHLVTDANAASQSVWEKFRQLFDLVERAGNAAKAVGAGAGSLALGGAALWAVLHGVEPQQQLPPASSDVVIEQSTLPADSSDDGAGVLSGGQ